MDDLTYQRLCDLLRVYDDTRGRARHWEELQEAAKASIMAILKEEQLREFESEDFKASIGTTARKSIMVEEAQRMLPADLFEKLLRTSVSVTLRITAVKKDKYEDATDNSLG